MKLNEISNAWMQNLYESEFAGNVGLWWADEGQLYVSLHEVEDGKTFDGNVHSVTSHEKAWKSVVLNHRPALRVFSYTYLPRGRIYCNRETKKFFVVGTPGLLELPKFQEELKQQFDIANLTVSNEADEHYTGDMAADIGVTLKTIAYWK